MVALLAKDRARDPRRIPGGDGHCAQGVADRAAITWGVNVGIVSTLRLPGCRAAPGTWNAYAGGFYLRSSSACVPLVFDVGHHSAVVRIGVGRRC